MPATAAAAATAAGSSSLASFAPYAAAGANMLGSFLNSQTSSKNLKRAIAAQSEENEKAYMRNVEQWLRENEYNLPVNQVKRLIDAGLNPNLAYGNLNNTASNNSPVAQPNDMSGIAKIGSPVGSALAAANISQIEKTRAETENIRQNTEKQKQETEGQRLQNIITDVEAGNAVKVGQLEIEGLTLDNKNKEKSAEMIDKSMQEIDEKVTYLKEQTNLLRAKIEEQGIVNVMKRFEQTKQSEQWKLLVQETQSRINSNNASAKLSYTEAEDMLTTQALRLTGLSASASEKYAHVNYTNTQRMVAEKQGYVLEMQGESLKIKNSYEGSVYHTFMKGASELLSNAYLGVQTAASAAALMAGGPAAGAAVTTIQPLSSVGVPFN